MRDFFGLVAAEIPPDLEEEQLMAFYRQQLKKACDLQYAADLVVSHPDQERTKFRLVVGGHHEEVIRLFRDVERRVIGQEASSVRLDAKERKRLERTHQPFLFESQAPDEDRRYAALRSQGLQEVKSFLPELLQRMGKIQYRRLWPSVLEACHISESDLRRLLWDMSKEERIVLSNAMPRDRTVKDHHQILLADRTDS